MRRRRIGSGFRGPTAPFKVIIGCPIAAVENREPTAAVEVLELALEEWVEPVAAKVEPAGAVARAVISAGAGAWAVLEERLAGLVSGVGWSDFSRQQDWVTKRRPDCHRRFHQHQNGCGERRRGESYRLHTRESHLASATVVSRQSSLKRKTADD